MQLVEKVSESLNDIMKNVGQMENEAAMVRAHFAAIIVNAGGRIEINEPDLQQCLNNAYTIHVEFDKELNKVVIETRLVTPPATIEA